MEKFDPRRATIGVHNRTGFVPGNKPANKGSQSVDVYEEDIAAGVALGKDDGRNFELERAQALRIGGSSYLDTYESLDKEAEDSQFYDGGEYSPENVEWPQFPEPGDIDVKAINRQGPKNVDLEVHGAHQHPKPDPKQLIKERLLNMRHQMMHKAKKEVQEGQEREEKRHESFKSMPVDIDVDRKEVDKDRGGSIAKTGSSVLSLLEEEDANPIKLMLIMDQAWSDDWRNWEPETIIQTLEMEGIDVAKINLDKIMALKVLMNTTEFWNSPRTFEKVCLAFSGRMVDWGHIQEPRVHDMAACVTLVERYVAEHEFSDDVAAYVAGSAVRDGYVLLPPVLSFAEFPFANELAFSMGDDVLDVQTSLMKALEEEGDIPKDHAVQYMRLLRCQYHTQEMVDQART